MSRKFYCDSCKVELGILNGNHLENSRRTINGFEVSFKITPASSTNVADLCGKCTATLALKAAQLISTGKYEAPTWYAPSSGGSHDR